MKRKQLQHTGPQVLVASRPIWSDVPRPCNNDSVIMLSNPAEVKPSLPDRERRFAF